jgi:nitric oxide reductase subunit B
MKLLPWLPFTRKARQNSRSAQKIHPEPQFRIQKVSRLYCLAAMFLFALQSLVAMLGALDVAIPDLPSPVPFAYGRAIHLGLATLWPLIGTMGMIYFFTASEINSEIFSLRLAQWQFLLVILSAGAILGSLALRLGNGREFLEGLPVFYLGIALSLALGAYNLVRTLLSHRQRVTPAAAIMTVGMVFLLLLLLPNVLSYRNPVADEATRFWIVHLWEEMALELTSAGFIAAFFVAAGLAARRQIVKWLYLESTLAVAGGFFGTGHHYYWIGFPAAWLIIGLFFSLVELVPVGMLVHMTYQGLNSTKVRTRREKLTLWLLLSSIFYHVTGASLLGLLIAIPWVNLYMHGTYLTSGHAHLALFGTLGFLVIAGCYYILSRNSEPSLKSYRRGVLAVVFLNGGLLIMGLSLLAAGSLQAYFWRMNGLDFMQVQVLIHPYLLFRVLGGAVFALGDILIFWCIFAAWRQSEPPAAEPVSEGSL